MHSGRKIRTIPVEKIAVVFVGLLAVAYLFSGCMSWKPDWDQSDYPVDAADADRLLEQADRLILAAGSRSELLNAIDAYEVVLGADAANFSALTNLGHLYILLGAAYTADRSEKIGHYITARRYNERAMYTQPAFRKRVNDGEKPWEACEALTQREVPAMFYWVTAVMYHFKEGMSLPGKVANKQWIDWCGIFLHRIEAIDPDWGGGGVQFSLALYYGILPKSLGGDRQRSDAYLARSIEIGPEWLINRWGRAKYFHVRDGNKLDFEKDLQWVVAQNLQHAGGIYPWKVYFQRDAEQMLAAADQYF